MTSFAGLVEPVDVLPKILSIYVHKLEHLRSQSSKFAIVLLLRPTTHNQPAQILSITIR